MDRDINAEIEAATQRLAEATRPMERLKNQFIQEVGSFLSSWYWTMAENSITRKPDRTQAIAPEELSSLKAEVKQLQDDAAAISKEYLDQRDLWVHLMSEPTPNSVVYSTKSRLEKAIRLAAGQLAPVLEKHGFLDSTEHHGSQGDYWREWDQSGNRHPPNARPYYPYSLDWPTALLGLTEKYDKMSKTYEEQRKSLRALESEKESAQAKELWDKA